LINCGKVIKYKGWQTNTKLTLMLIMFCYSVWSHCMTDAGCWMWSDFIVTFEYYFHIAHISECSCLLLLLFLVFLCILLYWTVWYLSTVRSILHLPSRHINLKFSIITKQMLTFKPMCWHVCQLSVLRLFYCMLSIAFLEVLCILP